MNSYLKRQLNNLKIEDFIWLIYLFLAIAAIISNIYEREFILKKDKSANNIFRKINITIFVITFFIYLYFVFLNWHNIEEIKKDISKNRNTLNSEARLIAALLFLIGGIIYLITEINDYEDTEIGFI